MELVGLPPFDRQLTVSGWTRMCLSVTDKCRHDCTGGWRRLQLPFQRLQRFHHHLSRHSAGWVRRGGGCGGCGEMKYNHYIIDLIMVRFTWRAFGFVHVGFGGSPFVLGREAGQGVYSSGRATGEQHQCRGHGRRQGKGGGTGSCGRGSSFQGCTVPGYGPYAHGPAARVLDSD